MPRASIVLNAALGLIALLAVAYVVRELRAPAPMPSAARRPAPAPAPVSVTPPPPAPVTPPGGYNVVAARNLFSPTRSESPVSPVAAGAPAVPKPNLYGILLRDGNPVAYLEDPTTKRVAGYRLGDSVAGGTLKQIAADHVVLNRPEGDVSVGLRDPSKPRPAVATAPGQAASPRPAVPGAPPVPGVAPIPGAPGIPVMPQPLPQQPVPSVGLPPGTPPVLPRRPLPPNLSRRLPPAGTDAPTQD